MHIRSIDHSIMLETTHEPDSPSNSVPKSPKITQGPYWPAIAHWDHVPAWLRDNEFISRGHPLPTFSFRRSYRLWRCLHNESVNIYSHFLGSAFFVATGFTLLGYVHSSYHSSTATVGDRFAFGSFLTSSATCFGISATFHTLRSHSYNVHHFWGRMDILDISISALGGGVSATFYAFYCNSKLQRIYWAIVSRQFPQYRSNTDREAQTLASAIAAASTLIVGAHRSPKWRTLRGGVFAILGVSAMLPIFHSIGLLGWKQAKVQIGAQWFLAEGLSLLTAVLIFVVSGVTDFIPSPNLIVK